MIVTSCQRNALIDIPQDTGATVVELVGVDVLVVLEGAVPTLLLVLSLMDTPMLDSGLLVIVSEAVRDELPLILGPAALEEMGTELPKEEHAC